MAYTPLHLQNLAELKLRVGNTTDTAIATILGLNYPSTEGFSVYVWNNTSTAIGDDNEVVVPTPRVGQAGRWIKIDLLALQFEVDPTVPSHVKAITAIDINKWNSKQDSVVAGEGLTKTNNTLEVDDSVIMTRESAEQSLSTIEDEMSNKVDKSTTVTINGTSYDLSLNRIYNVGNVRTDEVYNNPSWLNTYAYSKITGKPTKLSDFSNDSGFINNVPAQTFASLTGKPTTAAGYGITDVYPLTGNPSGFLTAQANADWNASSGATQILNKPVVPTNTNQLTNGAGFITTVPAQTFASLTGKPTTVLGYGITDALTGISSIQVTTALGYSPVNPNGTVLQYITGNGTKVTFPTLPSTTTDITEGNNLYFTNSRVRTAVSLTTTGTSGAATYNSTTGVLNVPNYAVSAPTFNPAPARTLNSNYTISTTKNARVSYTVALTTTLSLLNLNSAARVYLEYSTDSGTTWLSINSAGTSRTLAVAISVGLNETTYWNLVGEVPANALVRLRSVLSGSGTANYDSGIEVTY